MYGVLKKVIDFEMREKSDTSQLKLRCIAFYCNSCSIQAAKNSSQWFP